MNKVAFTDGLAQIYTVNGRSLKEKIGTFAFHEETIGIKAYYGANTIGEQIDRVISIPFNNLIDKSRAIGIENHDGEMDYYTISLIQKKDTFPKSLKITLTKTPLRWKDDKVL